MRKEITNSGYWRITGKLDEEIGAGGYNRGRMLEFHSLRIACCIAELWLAWTLRSGPLVYSPESQQRQYANPSGAPRRAFLGTIGRMPLTLLLLASAAFHAIPAQVFSPWWLRAVQTPMLALLLALSIAVSVNLLGFVKGPEGRYLLAAAVAAGCIPALAGWLWHPENWYQAMMIARQYAVIGLAVGFGLAWAWVRHMEPVEGQKDAPLGLWLLWLAAGIPEAISTTGGLLWAVLPWHDGLIYWRVANAAALLVRLAVVTTWAVSLRQQRVASPDPKADSRVIAASLESR